MTPSHRLPLGGSALGALVGSVLAASPGVAATPKTHVIKAQDIAFTPSHLVIHRGERVTWRFLDAKLLSPHTVTSEGSQRFKDSPQPRLTGSFTATFSQRGSYRFHCTIHPASMNGVIVVR